MNSAFVVLITQQRCELSSKDCKLNFC